MDVAPKKRPVVALLAAASLLGVGALALFAGRGELGRLHACRTCPKADVPLDQGWLEVPPGDAWALSLEPGVAAVVEGPARFQIAGPRPGHRTLALSRGRLFARSRTEAHVVVMLPRSEAAGVHGCTVSNAGPGALLEIESTATGNSVAAVDGALLIESPETAPRIEAGARWQSGSQPPALAPPEPQSLAWLEELTAR